MDQLFAQARTVAALLVARRQTIAVAESSTGGLISAALLAVPGASAFYLGGGVIYTPRARHRLLDLRREDVRGLKSASEPYAALLAETVRRRFSAYWGCPRPARRGRPAIPMAMRLGIRALRSPAATPWRVPSRPGGPSGSPTWSTSRSRRWLCSGSASRPEHRAAGHRAVDKFAATACKFHQPGRHSFR